MLGEPEVCNFDVTVSAEKNVLWLKVAIYDVEGVEVVEGKSHFSGIELGYRVGEPLLSVNRCSTTNLALSEQAEKLSTCHKVHDHVEVVDVLECSPQVDKEGVPDADQHLSFRICVLNLLHLDNLFLIENLDSIESAIVFGANKMNTPKGASTESQWSACAEGPSTYVRSIAKSARAYLPAVLRRGWAPAFWRPLVGVLVPDDA